MSNISADDHNEWLLALAGIKPISSTPRVDEKPLPRAKVSAPLPCVIRSHDLHGMTVDDAYWYTLSLCEEAVDHQVPELRIITGKSGLISVEFAQWLNTPQFRKLIRGYTKESTGGSFIVYLV